MTFIKMTSAVALTALASIAATSVSNAGTVENIVNHEHVLTINSVGEMENRDRSVGTFAHAEFDTSLGTLTSVDVTVTEHRTRMETTTVGENRGFAERNNLRAVARSFSGTGSAVTIGGETSRVVPGRPARVGCIVHGIDATCDGQTNRNFNRTGSDLTQTFSADVWDSIDPLAIRTSGRTVSDFGTTEAVFRTFVTVSYVFNFTPASAIGATVANSPVLPSVPLPAGAVLLLGALGGLGVMARRRRT